MYSNSVPAFLSKNVGNALTNYKTWGGIIYNVKAYGAKGNGSADDTAIILAANEAAHLTGGTLFFPPGTYNMTEELHKYSNVRIVGDSYITTIIDFVGTSSGITALEDGPNYIAHAPIENIRINSHGSGSVGIDLRYVQTMTFRNVSVQGFTRQGINLNFGIMCSFYDCTIFSNGAGGYPQVEVGESTTTTLFSNTYIAGGINIGTGGTVSGLRCSTTSTLHYLGGAIEGTGVLIQLLSNCSAMTFITDLEGPYQTYIEMGYGAESTIPGNISNITVMNSNFQSGDTNGILYGIKMKHCAQINILNNVMGIPTASLIANIWLQDNLNSGIAVGPNMIQGGVYIVKDGSSPTSNPTTSQVWYSNGIASDTDLRSPHSDFNGISTGIAGTAGDLSMMQDDRGTVKRVLILAENYKNNTPVDVTFPVAFTSQNAVTHNDTGLTLTLALDKVTVTAASSSTTYVGVIEIAGR